MARAKMETIETEGKRKEIGKSINSFDELKKVVETHSFKSSHRSAFKKEMIEKFPKEAAKIEELIQIKKREKVEGEKTVKRQKRQVTFNSIKKLINSLFIGITEDEEKKVSELFTPIETFYTERKTAIEQRVEAIRLENEIKADEENLKKKKERVAELKEGKASVTEPPKKAPAKAAPEKEEKGVPKGKRAPKKK